LLDALRPRILTDCDVPLALLYWTSTNGIVFIDTWAVRRSLVHPDSDGSMLFLEGARRKCEGEAMYLQFQSQIEDIRANESGLETLAAAQCFDFLSPVGILPVSGILSLGGGTASSGFDLSIFFGDNVCSVPSIIEGAQLSSLLRDSLICPPIEIGSKELIWLYYIRENRKSIDDKTGNVQQPYLVFASGHGPHPRARFDLNRWGYSNYA
jgi:hypothetical protein